MSGVMKHPVPPRFPCGRWLGKGVGDGSLERVLIGQLVSPGGEEDAGRWSGTPPELASPSQSVRTVLGSLGGRSSTYNEHVTFLSIVADLLVFMRITMTEFPPISPFSLTSFLLPSYPIHPPVSILAYSPCLPFVFTYPHRNDVC